MRGEEEKRRMRMNMRTQSCRIIKFFPTPFESGIFPTCIQRIRIWIKLFLILPVVSKMTENKDPVLLSFFFFNFENVYEAGLSWCLSKI